MNRKAYIKIMLALVHLMVTIMEEMGRVPADTAKKVGENVFKALTGQSEKN